MRRAAVRTGGAARQGVLRRRPQQAAGPRPGPGQGLRQGLRPLSTSAVEKCPGPPAVTLAELLEKSKPVVSVSASATAQDVVIAMTERAASTVFVEDAGVVVGVVKEKHIVDHADHTGGDFSQRASDFMGTDVSYASLSSTIRESLHLLNLSKQDHLPILQRQQADGLVRVEDVRVLDVTAIISAKHIIGHMYLEAVGPVAGVSEEERAQREAEAQQLLQLPTVKSIMKSRKAAAAAAGSGMENIVLNTLVHDDISVADTAKMMAKYDRGSVAVMDVCRDVPMLVGLATEQDLVRRAYSQQLDVHTTPISAIMTSENLSTVCSRDTLLTCAYRMTEKSVRHLPVVSNKGEHILAMISAGDVVEYLSKSFPAHQHE